MCPHCASGQPAAAKRACTVHCSHVLSRLASSPALCCPSPPPPPPPIHGAVTLTISVHPRDLLIHPLAPTSTPTPPPLLPADDPHTKANLLLQAHLGRLPLPISDYVTDTKGVLDNSLRILQVRRRLPQKQAATRCRNRETSARSTACLSAVVAPCLGRLARGFCCAREHAGAKPGRPIGLPGPVPLPARPPPAR